MAIKNSLQRSLTSALSKTVQKEIAKLSTNAKADSKVNRDGSTTVSTKTTKGKTTKSGELTTKDGRGKEAHLKYETSSQTGNKTIKDKLKLDTDFFGRTATSKTRETEVKKGNVTTTDSKTKTKDKFGFETSSDARSVATKDGSTTKTATTTTTKGPDAPSFAKFMGLGNTSTVVENKTVSQPEGSKWKTTTSSKSTTGTTFKSNSEAKLDVDKGTYTLKDSADWKKSSFNKEVSGSKEKELKKTDKGFSQVKEGKLDKAQKAGDLLAAAGMKTTAWQGEKWDTTKDPGNFKNIASDPNSFVGWRKGTSGDSNVTVGTDGVKATYKREAVAGLYAETKGTLGQYGSYEAKSKLEAKASVDAKGTLNANGLDANVKLYAGVAAEASVKAKAEKQVGTLAGVPVKVGVEGNAKVAAEAKLEASGSAKLTRNPPTALLEGSAGASAVAKAEADVKVSAGPFSVKASGYVSAGAEAKASGVVGYQDGKLKLGGSLGAALGVGAGGSVAVEVDVKQIGQMAHNAADRNGDGKLGLDDISAGAAQTAKAVSSTVTSAVSSTASKVAGWFGW